VKILFDQGTPAPLRLHLSPHSVDTVAERGWSTFSNGDLLRRSQEAGYELLITTDQNLRYQQNITGRALGILVLMSTSWPRIQFRLTEIVGAINRAHPGSYEEVPV
jgi:hypothetical protein